jgi:hypothetical protein
LVLFHLLLLNNLYDVLPIRGGITSIVCWIMIPTRGEKSEYQDHSHPWGTLWNTAGLWQLFPGHFVGSWQKPKGNLSPLSTFVGAVWWTAPARIRENLSIIGILARSQESSRFAL